MRRTQGNPEPRTSVPDDQVNCCGHNLTWSDGLAQHENPCLLHDFKSDCKEKRRKNRWQFFADVVSSIQKSRESRRTAMREGQADFTSQDLPILSCASSKLKNKLSTSDSQVQTEPISYEPKRTQAPKTQEAETEYMPPEEATPLSRSLGRTNMHDALANFLAEAVPDIEQHLYRNLQSDAFAGYEVSWEDEYDAVECLHSLKHASPLPPTIPADALHSCTAISWNTMGNLVAAAYGPLNRQSWALGESAMCVWSIMRRQLDPNKADNVITLEHSISCLAFHPRDVSLIAGGSFNGEVLLWRLSEDGDQLVCKTALDEYAHHEAVQQIEWTYSASHGGYVLCSISADGKVLIWTVANSLRHPVLGFRLPTVYSEVGEANGTSDTLVGKGGGRASALSFSVENPNTFVVGVESGGLFQCSLGANAQRSADEVRNMPSDLPWSVVAATMMTRVPTTDFHGMKRRVERDALLSNEKEVTLRSIFAIQPDVDALFRSPVNFSFDPHFGPVYSVACSPLYRNVMASASTDGSLRVYHRLQPAPLLILEIPPRGEAAFSCTWSPVRPAVLAVGSADGYLHLYDFMKNRSKPVTSLKVTSDGSAVYEVSFNPCEHGLIATADAQGVVKLWRVSNDLSNFQPGEEKMWESLTRSFLEDDSPKF